jgi:hypothetical protein
MRMGYRFSVLAATAVLGVATVLGLTACAGAGRTAVDAAADLGPEGQALAALGFDPVDLGVDPAAAGAPVEFARAAATPDPSATPSRAGRVGDRPHRRPLARMMVRRNVLHGEAVVQTKDGPKTVVVQRGEVTRIDDTTVTVKSSDGFTLTWTFGDPIRVLERRHTVQPEEISMGTRIGIAGAKDGDATVARLIVVARPK